MAAERSDDDGPSGPIKFSGGNCLLRLIVRLVSSLSWTPRRNTGRKEAPRVLRTRPFTHRSMAHLSRSFILTPWQVLLCRPQTRPPIHSFGGDPRSAMVRAVGPTSTIPPWWKEHRAQFGSGPKCAPRVGEQAVIERSACRKFEERA